MRHIQDHTGPWWSLLCLCIIHFTIFYLTHAIHAMGATEAGSKDVEALIALAVWSRWWRVLVAAESSNSKGYVENVNEIVMETKKEEADAPPNAWGTDGVSAAYVGIYCNDTASSWENKSLRHIKTKDADAKIVLKVSSFHFVSKSTR